MGNCCDSHTYQRYESHDEQVRKIKQTVANARRKGIKVIVLKRNDYLWSVMDSLRRDGYNISFDWNREKYIIKW